MTTENKAPRKTIQIAAVPETDGNYPGIFALCDDGTIFYLRLGTDQWHAEPPIPQPGDSELPA